ncbi:MAG: hypothetical protein COB02_05550 [Candidatus Cloacimonadota bacterium]|nr:MAG: hypothetical protein COB02_05550 [Candidatus Cloacimonadota bacterium]
MKFLLIYFLLILDLYSKGPVLEIGILQGQKKVKIHAKYGFRVFDIKDNKKKIFTRWNKKPLTIFETTHGIGFLRKKNFQKLYIKTFKKANVWVNNRAYRGNIIVFEDKFGKLTVVNEIGIELYLYSVIKSEMLITSPIEALKAQAVVARTYAMKNKDKFREKFGFGLTDDVRSQVYSGVESERPLAIKVVNDTKGLVITYEKKLISTYYHSACGGSTLDSKDWLGKPLKFLKSKPCTWCNAYKNYYWDLDLPYPKIKNILRLNGYKLSKIKSISFTYSKKGRMKLLKIKHPKGSISMSAAKLRKLISPSIMRSTMVKERLSKNSNRDEIAIMDILNRFKKKMFPKILHFSGKGFGHGVGLCQWGAKGLAKQKKTFEEILKYYYSDVQIIKTYY